jgi:hypothetical protein
VEAVVVHEDAGSLLSSVLPDGRIWRQGQRHRHLIHHVVEAGTVLVRCVGEVLVDKLVLDHEHVQQHVDDELHLMLLEEEGVALVLHLVHDTSNQLGFLIGTD